MAYGLWLMASSRHRIVAGAAQGMASQQAPDGEPQTADGAVGGQRLYRVLRARRDVAAVTSEQGAQGRLIEADRENKYAIWSERSVAASGQTLALCAPRPIDKAAAPGRKAR